MFEGLGGALIGGASNLLGGLLGSSGQRDANRKNLQIAREQMDFQREMSNTAYQRQVKDLRLAGLNPILGYSKGSGGASSPIGASAKMENEKAMLAHSAKQLGLLTAQIENVKSDTNLKNKQAMSQSAQAEASDFLADGIRFVKELAGNGGSILNSAKDYYMNKYDAMVEASTNHDKTASDGKSKIPRVVVKGGVAPGVLDLPLRERLKVVEMPYKKQVEYMKRRNK